MYEVKKTSQLRKFFRHNSYTEGAMAAVFNWLEKVNANFKNEDDFNARMPKLIERYLVDTNEDASWREVTAGAYFGVRDYAFKWQELLNKKTKTSKPAEDAEEPTEKKGEPKRRVSGTERVYANGNTEIYKTTIDNEPTLMILIKNYSTDSLIKSLVSEFVEDIFDILSF